MQISMGNVYQAEGTDDAKALTWKHGWCLPRLTKQVTKAAAESSRRITRDEIRELMFVVGWQTIVKDIDFYLE